MPDLKTTYLGLNLKNPIIPSASPLSRDVASIRRLEDAGAAAVVMYSLFEEQIVHDSEELDHYMNFGLESNPEAMSYFPEMKTYNVGPDEYLALIRAAKAAVDIPVIGSLNGVSDGGWVRYAKLIEEAGADALELNIYYIPTDAQMDSGAVEHRYYQIVRSVRQCINIPLAVKLSPFFSSMAYVCKRICSEGADGLVLFNRFYQPDLDIKNMMVAPDLVLSTSEELRLRLRWAAILHGKTLGDIAITGGVHTHEDILKSIMVGANVVQIASEILKNGPKRIPQLLQDVERWMEENEYLSLSQMRGSLSQKKVVDPAMFERANYMKVLQSYRPDPTGRL